MQFLIPAQHRAAAGVYIIRNSVDNRIYIGGALSLFKRFQTHKNELEAKRHHAGRLQQFVNQYGLGTLSFSLLELVSQGQDIGPIEQKWINQTQAHVADFGFNGSSIATSRVVAEAPKQLNVVLEAAELETAKAVAKKRGVSTSSLVRMLILDEARRLGVE